MALKLYHQKRDFKKTPEPSGKARDGAVPKSKRPRFVIQKHEASHLHYDFRLELGGALKSWAVPKGPPFAKGGKRLAMEVEDHPVSYMRFEGVIPKGQYGGGTVMVWDHGTFEPLSDAPLRDLAGGKLHFILRGKKLAGEWYLVRTRRGEEKNQWLLIKGGEDMKPVSKKSDDTSSLSGKSMKALSAGDKTWNSNRAEKISKTRGAIAAKTPDEKIAATGAARPRAKKTSGELLAFFDPMKARLVKSAPPGEWLYEIKFDGYRALAFLGKNGVELLSRNNKDLAEKFPEVVRSLQKLNMRNTVLDGEIVALNPKGRSSFQLLQSLELGQEHPPLLFYVFDLPQQDGEDLRGLPLTERRRRLEKLLRRPPGNLRFSESVGRDGEKLLAQARGLGLEGLIGKRADSLYETGRRSGAWIKLKTHREQEFVIGGYTDPEGERKHFGALLVGVYERGKLIFCGKVGTGFQEALLRVLRARFGKVAQTECPFADLPEAKPGRYGSGVTRAEMKRCHWLRPLLVAQVKFSEWTRDGKLRQPVFLGLREDKQAREVGREEPADG